MRRPDSPPWPRTRRRMAAGESRPPTPSSPMIRGAAETPSRRSTSADASWHAVQEASATRFSAAADVHSLIDAGVTLDPVPGSPHPPREAKAISAEATPRGVVEFEAIDPPPVLRRIFTMFSRGRDSDVSMVTVVPRSTRVLLGKANRYGPIFRSWPPRGAGGEYRARHACHTKRRRTMQHETW